MGYPGLLSRVLVFGPVSIEDLVMAGGMNLMVSLMFLLAMSIGMS